MITRPVWQVAVTPQAVQSPARLNRPMAFYDTSGSPLFMVSALPTGANVLLTGYVTGAVGALAAADSINVAFRKLEARIVALESA